MKPQGPVSRPWWPAHPGKRSVERFWLLYTPVWGIVAGIVMVSGWAERWGDVPLMVFGAVLGLGAVVGPFVTRPASEREIPLTQTVAFKLGLSVVLLAFGLNYTQTPYFWDVLHMHYGFQATWTIQNNPIFLYFLTIAYFATYATLTMMAWRMLRYWSGNNAVGRAASWIVAPMAMAFLETALNANPFMPSLFCYDDMRLMLWFGTLSYGVAFVFALPMWLAIDEVPSKRVSATLVVVFAAAALYLDLIVLDLLRYNVAPHFTEVIEGANGLRDFDTSCLELPD